MFPFSSRCSRSNCWFSCASKASRVCPSTPPLPRFSFTFSQAISRFFRSYTLSINEWTFSAPVGLIQSASLLGRERTGFSLKELFQPPSSLLIWFSLSSQPSSPAAFPNPFGCRLPGHMAFATLQVLFSWPTTDRDWLALSLTLIGPLTPEPPGDSASSPEVTRCSSVPCRPQTPWCGG